MRAIMKKNEAGCDGRECDSAESGELRDQARSAGNVATVTMGIGAAGLATAAVLFWVVSEPGPESPESADSSMDRESFIPWWRRTAAACHCAESSERTSAHLAPSTTSRHGALCGAVPRRPRRE